MYDFGSIVLTRFPFTNLSGDKRRPALVVSRHNQRRGEVVVCFITSVPRPGLDMAPIAPTPGTGLKVSSVVRFDKLTALDPALIAGKLGAAPPDWLHAHRTKFSGLFGFYGRSSQRSKVKSFDERVRRASDLAVRARMNLDLFAFLIQKFSFDKFGAVLDERFHLFDFIGTASEHAFLSRVVNLFTRRSDTDNLPDLVDEAERVNALDTITSAAVRDRIGAADEAYKRAKLIRNKIVSHQDDSRTKPEIYKQAKPTLSMYFGLSDQSLAIVDILCSARGLRRRPVFSAPVMQLEAMLVELQRRRADDRWGWL